MAPITDHLFPDLSVSFVSHAKQSGRPGIASEVLLAELLKKQPVKKLV